MGDLEGVPQWKRDLIRRRRAVHHHYQSQTAVRRGCGHADMLLQSPNANSSDLSADPTDCSEDGSATERSTPLRDTDIYTDSGEELTYGPGIVKKLKSRYLSLTLREANKTRPSIHGLRRATSLEHVLEDEKPTPPPRKYQPTAPTSTRQTRYRQPTRTPDAVRRARSVDALARCDSRSEPEDILSPVERESPISKDSFQPPPLLSPTLRPKRPPPLLKETERPPPDLVKQALKIFEGQPGKKLRTPSTGQVADKVKSFSETQTKKPNCAKLPRPAVPPRGALLTSSPEHKHIPVATQTTPSLYSRPPPSPKKFASHKDDKERSLSPVYVNRHPVILAPADTSPVKISPHNDFHIIKGLKPLDLKSPESSPRNSMLKSPDLLSPRETCHRQRNGVDESTAKDPYIRTSTPDPEILTQPAAAEISLIAPTSPHNRKPSERIKKYSSSDDDSVFEEEEEEKPPKTKVVDKSSLEKISKAGTTSQFSFNSVNGMNGNAKKSYLPSAKKQYSNSNSLNNKSEGVFLNNSKSNSNDSNSVSNSKSKVPDLIQMSNVKNAATLVSQPMTVADVKLIKPVISSVFPGCTSTSSSDNSEQCISASVPSEIVQTCPTLASNELRVVPDARRVKDIESSPALVDYNPPSPAPPPHGPKQNLSLSLSLTSREIEKNLINTSKSLAADPPFTNNDFTTRNSLEQPVKKVTVNMLEAPDKTKPSKSHLAEIEGGADVSTNGIVSSSTTTSVSVVQNNSDINIVICKETNSVVSNENNVSAGGSKVSGGRKPQWHQQESTTMLFDFSKRKGVPDYIENDGLIRRREKPKIGVGVISIEGLSGESCTDGTSDSGDEDWARRPPSPCDVAFENDNIVINGRSNISAGKPRTRHLKIQFDESLTTTFEYPSEASLGEEHFAGTNSSSSPSSPIATGGPLSSYTPSKVSLQAETFQLGVTRSHSQTSEKNGNVPQSNEGSLNNTMNSPSKSTSDTSNHDRKNAEEPYLKPCQEDQSHNWSHETHIGAGDLLF